MGDRSGWFASNGCYDVTRMELNRIECCDNVAGMRRLPAGCVALTVTSPPFDQMRKGFPTRWSPLRLAKQLLRITRRGGVAAVEIDEQMANGVESCTSHRMVLDFVEAGWSKKQELVIVQTGTPYPHSNRYHKTAHSVIVFCNGTDFRFEPNWLEDRPNVSAGKLLKRSNGDRFGNRRYVVQGKRVPLFGRRSDVWRYSPHDHGADQNERTVVISGQTSAIPTMHLRLARDLIVTYSRAGDLVFDPFAGSGTTLIAAMLARCDYLGFEIVPEHVALAEKRLERWNRASERRKAPFRRPRVNAPPPAEILSRSERVELERQIVLAIETAGGTFDERLARWQQQTGKSKSAFYRRRDELRKR
jgi:site-specific DNA-methyltransferase (adenine-specific)